MLRFRTCAARRAGAARDRGPRALPARVPARPDRGAALRGQRGGRRDRRRRDRARPRRPAGAGAAGRPRQPGRLPAAGAASATWSPDPSGSAIGCEHLDMSNISVTSARARSTGRTSTCRRTTARSCSSSTPRRSAGSPRSTRDCRSCTTTSRRRASTSSASRATSSATRSSSDDAEIATFCERNFGVTFPMFSKVDVNGSRAHTRSSSGCASRRAACSATRSGGTSPSSSSRKDGEVIGRYAPDDDAGEDHRATSRRRSRPDRPNGYRSRDHLQRDQARRGRRPRSPAGDLGRHWSTPA